MSGHTYIFEEIEILVYVGGRHFEFSDGLLIIT